MSEQYVPGVWYQWGAEQDHKSEKPPVPVGTLVEVKHRDGQYNIDRAGVIDGYAEAWDVCTEYNATEGDIMAFRIVEDV